MSSRVTWALPAYRQGEQPSTNAWESGRLAALLVVLFTSQLVTFCVAAESAAAFGPYLHLGRSVLRVCVSQEFSGGGADVQG